MYKREKVFFYNIYTVYKWIRRVKVAEVAAVWVEVIVEVVWAKVWVKVWVKVWEIYKTLNKI
jgi:hypothetical protein